LIVRGTAAGEMIPLHFQLNTESQNEEIQVWNTSLMKYMHDVHDRFGYDEPKYHPCTFKKKEKGGMIKDEFKEYIKN
jgi:hypothetical protein